MPNNHPQSSPALFRLLSSVLLFMLALTTLPHVATQSYDCSSAFTHQHNSLREAEIQVTRWEGCVMEGTINGVSVQLFADSSNCQLKKSVPGRLLIRYDQTCGQVLAATDGSTLPEECVVVVSPTPTPTPSLSPTPILGFPSGSSVEIVSPANVREFPTITAAVKFIATTGQQGVTAGDCQQDTASVNVYCFVNFTNATNGFVAAQFLKLAPGPTPTPTPIPTPTPAPTPSPTPTPTPTPTPSPTPCPKGLKKRGRC
jgi:hypothetical protein